MIEDLWDYELYTYEPDENNTISIDDWLKTIIVIVGSRGRRWLINLGFESVLEKTKQEKGMIANMATHGTTEVGGEWSSIKR